MKEPKYFSIYEDFFKDAKTFLNTAVETKNSIFDVSSSGGSSSGGKSDGGLEGRGKERHINFYLNDQSNRAVWHKDSSNEGRTTGKSSNRSVLNGRGLKRSGPNRSRPKRGHHNGEADAYKNNQCFSNMNHGASKILMCYQNTHTMCLSYKPYNENVCHDSANMNYSISIFKKRVPNFDMEEKKYAFDGTEEDNRVVRFLKKWAFWRYREKGRKFLLINEERRQLREGENIGRSSHMEDGTRTGKDVRRGMEKDSNKYSNKSIMTEASRNFSTNKGKGKSAKNAEEEAKKKSVIFNEMRRKKKERKKGISYEHLLTPSRHVYDAFCLFNPRFKQGKHHTVMCLQGYNVSVIPFVKAKKLKEEVNELFNEINPWIHKSLTLSKLRNLKIDLFNLISNIPQIDISTICCAWVFFERLVIKGYVHKSNRKLYAATCLILSLKFYQHDDMQILEKLLFYIQKLDKKENLTPSLIFSVEFLVYRLLDFSLQHTYEHIRPHIYQYLESKVSLSTSFRRSMSARHVNAAFAALFFFFFFAHPLRIFCIPFSDVFVAVPSLSNYLLCHFPNQELKFEDVYGISEEVYLCSNYPSEV
ncbi:cyclin dependent kinase binding protein, putative [Plasmodium knowlesi strain H]|uniref:Cyclin dependent kinase binding protein, putative n=1 Tax=Plasmodium knowlesi (strain H) TaxID=5851 RepID=A0A1A7VYJ1_PLAKH|nr:cyclin dependent kinase binding protein, putative [Plasmodium knowlesi strain H]